MSTFTDLFMPSELVESIWGDVTLPDTRLRSRLRRTVAMMIERLDAPVSHASRKLVVGAHRLWNNARVKPESLVEPMLAHQARLLAGAVSLIVAHDTMEIDLTGRYQTEDAGPLRSSHACGHLLHWSLAIDPTTRRPLAAIACNVWTRSMETRKGDSASRPLEARESFKWQREIEACSKELEGAAVDAVLTHVFDREGDTHDNFLYALDKQRRIITRAQQEHSIAEGPGTLREFFATEGTWEREPICTREVPTKASEAAMKEARKKGRAEVQTVRNALTKMGGHREASLRVRWAQVTLMPDAHKKKSTRRRSAKVWAVQVLEQNVPSFVEPLEWMLLTTVPVATLDDALWVVDGYRARWPIEPMHTVLKTGLHVEAQSVKDVSSARRLLSVLLPVSLHLMRWAYGWRETPQELASAQVPDAVVSALKTACRYHQLPLPRRAWTVKDVVLRLAALGGYERRPDRTPGWLVLWRGWRELLRFWRIAHFVENAAPHELPGKPPPDPSWKPRGS
jgi:hypothetical protein